ncbi:MAG: 50S ribosomal protein L21 [Bacteroides sp.]|nr:MAG: 50S ribosomal protein L21 [Bacteroides sp.]
MYSIVNISGKQFFVKKDMHLTVARLKNKINSLLYFNDVIMLKDNKDTIIGDPFIKDVKIVAEVEKHFKGDKVIVFKKKRRKSYKRKNGYRPLLTQILIKDIIFQKNN